MFAFSSVIFLLPYIVMMLAFVKLRRIDPNRPRPYRVPGGTTLTLLISWVPAFLLAVAAVFFVWNPWDYTLAVTGSLLVGLAVTVIFQEYFTWRSPKWTLDRALERGEDPDDVRLQFANTLD